MDSKSKELISLYLMFKKINAHIANKKKWAIDFFSKVLQLKDFDCAY